MLCLSDSVLLFHVSVKLESVLGILVTGDPILERVDEYALTPSALKAPVVVLKSGCCHVLMYCGLSWLLPHHFYLFFFFPILFISTVVYPVLSRANSISLSCICTSYLSQAVFWSVFDQLVCLFILDLSKS